MSESDDLSKKFKELEDRLGTSKLELKDRVRILSLELTRMMKAAEPHKEFVDFVRILTFELEAAVQLDRIKHPWKHRLLSTWQLFRWWRVFVSPVLVTCATRDADFWPRLRRLWRCMRCTECGRFLDLKVASLGFQMRMLEGPMFCESCQRRRPFRWTLPGARDAADASPPQAVR